MGSPAAFRGALFAEVRGVLLEEFRGACDMLPATWRRA